MYFAEAESIDTTRFLRTWYSWNNLLKDKQNPEALFKTIMLIMSDRKEG